MSGEDNEIDFHVRKAEAAARAECAAEIERLRGVEAALRDALEGVWDHVAGLKDEIARLRGEA